jgi:hypothetical protein
MVWSLAQTSFGCAVMMFHAEMTVDMTYNAPDRKEFKILSESGTKWIVKRVHKRLIETEREAQEAANRASVELNTQNYEFTSLDSTHREVLLIHPDPTKVICV